MQLLQNCELSELVGKVLSEITGLKENSGEIIFHTNQGCYMMYHEQDCCEWVRLVDFEDGLLKHEGAVVISADIVSNVPMSDTKVKPEDECYNWVFYKIQTSKGELWLRWLGESNGYYSTEVQFGEVSP